MTTTFIGDVHGDDIEYQAILKQCARSIQVGDLGVGFRFGSGPHDFYPDPSWALREAGGDHRFIRGNHDSPAACRRHPKWIPDGHVEGDMMFVGGALSIDRAYRTEGRDWWPDEELGIAELNGFVDKFARIKPRVMVTHECPESVADAIMASHNRTKINLPSRTRQAFQSMFERHQPDLWIHGHWHVSFDGAIEGTRFVCLAELEARTFDV